MQTIREYVSPFGKRIVSKIEHYGWSSIDKQPGEHKMIDKNKLHLDETYQRTPFREKTNRIASEFSWVAFGVLTVFIRAGVYNVVDGGHRLMAALKRNDVQLVPCMVWYVDDIKEEAKFFSLINTYRATMSFYYKHKSKVVQGDSVALLIDETLNKTGHKIGKSHGGSATSVACGKALTDAFTDNPENGSKLWPFIVELHDGNTIHNEIVSGIYYLANHCNVNILKEREKLLKEGHFGLLREIKKAKEYRYGGGRKVFADGIARVINSGRQQKNRIDVYASKGDDNGNDH